MSKRLVVCCDGTWNVPDQKSPTNVTKIALAVADEDRTGKQQRVFYHRGVGTNRWERLRGGAFGAGLSRNVCDTYRFIVENYEPGDELFFFGFSRGAFTARSTVGLVRNAGILRREHVNLIPDAYALYRSRTDTKTPRGREATLFRRSYSHETDIHFIGVWDTVGALGVPVEGWRLASLINRRFQFHDTDLSTRVHAAYQALAIDEKRRPFKPAVWSVQADAGADQKVEQVWFSGCHCDIGGGNEDHGLSDIPLLWMVDRAKRHGLHVNPMAFRPESTTAKPGDVVDSCTAVGPDPLAAVTESRTKFYRLQWPLHRGPLCFDAAANAKKETAAEDLWNDHGRRPQNAAFADNGERAAFTAVQRKSDDADYDPPGFRTFLDDQHVQPDTKYLEPVADEATSAQPGDRSPVAHRNGSPGSNGSAPSSGELAETAKL
jgi:Uncharacterized alpha/beta hydrolase domain (DUF2235)